MTDPGHRRGRVDQHTLGQYVRAFSAAGHEYTHGEGKVIAYAEQPTVLVECADGSRFSWMAHLCEVIDPPADPVAEPTDEEWLTANALAWSIEVNPEKLFYEDRRDYLETRAAMADDDPPEDLEELVTAEHLFEIRCYPTTPVGFMVLYASDRATALREMREAVQGPDDTTTTTPNGA